MRRLGLRTGVPARGRESALDALRPGHRMRRLGLRTGVPARGRESALDDDVRGEAGAVEPDGGAAGVELAAAAGAPVVRSGAVSAAGFAVLGMPYVWSGGESFGDT